MTSEIRDPFSITSDAATYIPSRAIEVALDSALQALERGASPAIVGPTGLGKSLLLQLIGDRLRGHARTLYIPFATLPAADFAELALGLLGCANTGDAAVSLVAEARREDGVGPLVLMIDDAASLPDDTARALSEWIEASHGRLQLVLASLPGQGIDGVVRSL